MFHILALQVGNGDDDVLHFVVEAFHEAVDFSFCWSNLQQLYQQDLLEDGLLEVHRQLLPHLQVIMYLDHHWWLIEEMLELKYFKLITD